MGTVTEIYDYLRLLYARIGHPHCPNCGRPIAQQTVQQIVDQVMTLPERTRIQVLAPVVRGRKGEHRKILEEIRKDGFVRVRVDGQMHEITDNIELNKNQKHDIEIVVDRIIIRPDIEGRLADSIEIALERGGGLAVIDVIDGEEMLFSEHLACAQCGISFEELSPRMFSFNSPYGACPECDGLGNRVEFDPDLFLDMELSINEGAIIPWAKTGSKWILGVLDGVCERLKIDKDQPLHTLSQTQLKGLLHGIKGKVVFPYTNQAGRQRTFEVEFDGIIGYLEKRSRETSSDYIQRELDQFRSSRLCSTCHGARLRPEALAVTVGGKNIDAVTRMSISEALEFFQHLDISEREMTIVHQVLKEIRERLRFLENVGLNYLTLNRMAATLSGGEAQRIRLATQIGSSLVGGVVYSR